MKGFVLSIDAGLAIGFAVIMAGAIIVMAQSSPVDSFWGPQEIARDYLVLNYSENLTGNISSIIVPTNIILNTTYPNNLNNTPTWYAKFYWPGYILGCGSVYCNLNKSSTQTVMLNGTQSIFNGTTYEYSVWATG